MTSSTSNSEALRPGLPGRAAQWRQFGRLCLRILLPLAVVWAVAAWATERVVRDKFIAETPSHGAAKLYRIQSADTGEIAIIGSSRALSTYIPDSLGPRYYNYGVNGIGYSVMDIFLGQVLARGGHQPVIVNFDYEMFYDQVGDINSYLPHMDIPALKSLLQRNGYYQPQFALMGLRYFGCIDAFAKDWLNERLELTRAINKGAALDKTPFDQAHLDRTIAQRRDSILDIKPRQGLLDSLYQRFATHPERRFFLTVAPYHPSYEASLSDATLHWAEAFFRKVDALPNADVLRWDVHAWPDRYFLNTTHVKLEGAILATALLKASIEDALHPPADSAAPLILPPKAHP